MGFIDKLNVFKIGNNSKTVNKQTVQSIPYISVFGGNYTANWISLAGQDELTKAYLNPCVQPAVNIWGRSVANQIRSIKNIKSGEVYDQETILSAPKDIQGLYKLLKNPNPFMNESEFLMFRTIMQKVNGNAYTYYRPFTGGEARGSLKLSDLVAIYSMWPQYVTPIVPNTPDLFPAELSDVVKAYSFVASNYKKTFSNYLVMHSNEPNIGLSFGINNNPYKGMSPLLPQQMPISNIQAALESRNVFHNNRGMLGIISSDMKDADGSMPLTESMREQFEKDMEGFGTKHGQSKYYITNANVKYTQMAISPKDLGLFEEVWNSSILIGNGLGVPKNLIETYLQGATFDNQNTSAVRFYQDSVIPFANGLNKGESQKLGLYDLGYEIVGSFDHLQILQEDEEKKAKRRSFNVRSAIEAFKYGAATVGDIAFANGSEIEDERTIFDLSEEERNIILNKATNGTNEGTNRAN